MKKRVASSLSSSHTSIWGSWTYVNDTFDNDFQALDKAGTLRMDGPFQVIWKTKQKYVLKAVASSGTTFAYKSYRKIRGTLKYLFRASPCCMEKRNFQLLTDCGIPLPKQLAVGEVRQAGRLKTAFIATDFAEGYADGRDFMPASNVINDAALLDEFIFRYLTMLARIHDNNILHRGFTPANLLYKLRQTPDEQGNKLDLMWIDVASCRKMSRFMLKCSLSVDFEQFFRFFDFDDDVLLKYLRHYCAAAKSPLASPEHLLRNLQKT